MADPHRGDGNSDLGGAAAMRKQDPLRKQEGLTQSAPAWRGILGPEEREEPDQMPRLFWA